MTKLQERFTMKKLALPIAMLILLLTPMVGSADFNNTDLVRIGPAGTHVFVVIRKCLRPTGVGHANGGNIYEYDRCSSIFASGAELTAYLQYLPDDVPVNAVMADGSPAPKPWDVGRRATKAYRLNVVDGTTLLKNITYLDVNRTETDHTYDTP